MNLYQAAIKRLQTRVEELEGERPSRQEHLRRVRQNEELNNCRRRALEELDLLEAFLKDATSRLGPMRNYVNVYDVHARLSTIKNVLRRAY